MISKLNITIVGWYGTETIGDRAILAGIIRLFSKISSDIYIQLGSLYPILSERTLRDDSDFLERCIHGCNLHINLFDSQSKSQLEHAIRHSNTLVVGGGPLMDIVQMHMVEYALVYAKKKRKKTIVLGCGYGPLEHTETIECANHILDMADLSIMRDGNAPQATIKNQLDPAAFACMKFLELHPQKRSSDFYAVNLRDIVAAGDHYHGSNELEERLTRWLAIFSKEADKPIQLIPMHTFSVGGDDRIILNRIANKINSPNIEVVSMPPSLEETMELYYNASLCIGMRFHAVVLQTLLNGNNIILDYTNPKTGKIIEFMRQLNLMELYHSRYISLCQPPNTLPLNVTEMRPLPITHEKIEQSLSTYVNMLTDILNR